MEIIRAGNGFTTAQVQDIAGNMFADTATIDYGYGGGSMTSSVKQDAVTWEDGWILKTETWTRTGNHTFTVSGDLTLKYRKGAKVRYNDGSTDYGVIASSSYSAGTGLTTVNLIVNTDYVMAATTINNRYLSYIDNPEAFPSWFTYSATLGGFSGTPSQTCKFHVSGRKITTLLQISGTSNATTFTATIPVANILGFSIFQGGFRAMDNSAAITATVPACVVSASSTTVTFYKDWAATGWTAGGTKEAQITLITEF